MSVVTSFFNLWKFKQFEEKKLTSEKRFHCIMLISLILPLPCTSFNATIPKYDDFRDKIYNSPLSPSPQKCPKLCSCYDGVSDISSRAPMLKDIKMKAESKFITDCVQVGITELPTSFPDNTRTFLLDHNSIKVLSNSNKEQNKSAALKFSNYANLEEFSLRENQLQQIDRYVFHDFHSVRSLILSHNYIPNLVWTVGDFGRSLLYLDVSFNRIPSLNKGDFEKMHSLKRLDLSNNNIESIGPFAFESLTSLEYLDLSSNEISNHGLHQEAFSQLRTLWFLSFANNYRITRVPQFDVLGLEPGTLETLDLHGLHYLTSIESVAFDRLSRLKALNLSFCALNALQLGWLNGGPGQSLEVLDLSHNRFTEIKSNFFVSAALDTEMEIHPTEPQQDLRSPSYVVSSSVLETKSQLSFIKYEGHLTTSQEKILYRPLQMLTWLSISDNRNLKSLDNDAFLFLPKLEYLFLQNCNVSKMKIASINYQYSDTGLLSTLPSLKGIWVYGNPMYCDCHVRVIRTVASTLTSNCRSNYNSSKNGLVLLDSDQYFYEGRCINVTSAGKSMCYPRQSIEAFPIILVPQSYLFCPEEPLSLFIAMCIGPFAFAAAIALVFLCGWFTVLINRARRYNICSYQLNRDKTIELPVHKSAPVRKTAIRTKMSRNPNYSPAPPHRHNRGTNLVMGNLRLTGQESSHIPTSLLGSFRPISGSASPGKPQKKENRYLSSVPSISVEKAESTDIQLNELSRSSLSNSYPDISTKLKVNGERKEHWKHSFPESSSSHDDILHYIDSDDARTLASETEFLVAPRQEHHYDETSYLCPSSSSLSATGTKDDTSSDDGHENSQILFGYPASALRTRKERFLQRDLS